MSTHKVTLKPSGKVIEVNNETNLLQALRENDVYVKSSCGGVASCSDCICKIVTGEDNLESPPFAELKLLGNVFHITKERLLCQTKVLGDVTIDITNHDKATDEDRLKSKTSKNFSKKKAPVKVRTKDEFDKIKEERFQKSKEKRDTEGNWNRFWEKEDPQGRSKSLGGNKRPKFFDTDKAEEATKRTLAKNLEKKEQFKNYDDDNNSSNKKNASDRATEKKDENKDFKKFRRD